ncbi:hypothetical protein D3C81_1569000 [compost metagenome]
MYTGKPASAWMASFADASDQPPFESATITVLSSPASTLALVRATSSNGLLPTFNWKRLTPSARRSLMNSAIDSGLPNGTASYRGNRSLMTPPSNAEIGRFSDLPRISQQAISIGLFANSCPIKVAFMIALTFKILVGSAPISAAPKSFKAVRIPSGKVGRYTLPSVVISPQPSMPSSVRMRTTIPSSVEATRSPDITYVP